MSLLVVEFGVSPFEAWRCTLRDLTSMIAYRTAGLLRKRPPVMDDIRLEGLRRHLSEKLGMPL